MFRNESLLYQKYCRPRLGELLAAINLDKVFTRGLGDYLYFLDDSDKEVKVLDMLGGYGASLFGHNNPLLVGEMREFLDKEMVFNGQASCKKYAALVAEKLDSILFKRFNRHFITTFASTGAEAVETAMKHAEFSLVLRFEEIHKQVYKKTVQIKNALKNKEVVLSNDFYDIALEKLGMTKDAPVSSVLTTIQSYNRMVFMTPPTFLSAKKSFHGLLTGSLKLTSSKHYRLPFYRIGPKTLFIDYDLDDSLENAVPENELTYLMPDIIDGKVVISLKNLTNIAGFFIEPLQGEGGIRWMPDNFIKSARAFADKHKIPLIFDEIQCGMGRTGTFLASEKYGVRADYYIFSKSLGGGLTKISALSIDKKYYEDDFSLIHNATFTEDDLSAKVALKALDMIDNSPELMKKAADSGALIIEGLKKIQEDYPEVISGVRGAGLMIGIEFSDQSDCDSYGIRAVSQSEALGFAIAGYLLNECGIRVAPTMSNSAVIRVEPSLYISEEDISFFLKAIERLCKIIYCQNSYELIKFIAFSPKSQIDAPVEDFHLILENEHKEQRSWESMQNIRKAAMAVHFISVDDFDTFDPAFKYFTTKEREILVSRLHKEIYPMTYLPRLIESQNGEKVLLYFIGLFLDSSTIYHHLQTKNIEPMRNLVHKAADKAIELNCSVLGLGGYTSIVTRNGKSIETDRIAVTTGNAHTVQKGLEAIKKEAEDKQIEIHRATAGVVGATGNIGSIYSLMIAHSVENLIIFGRPGREQTLRGIAGEIIESIIEKIGRALKNNTKINGIAAKIANTETVKKAIQNNLQLSLAELYLALQKEMEDDSPIKISTNLYELKKCDIILTASNSSAPIIFSEMIDDSKPVIINDISVPLDTDGSVHKMKNVSVIKGGIVKLPLNQQHSFESLMLEKGNVFACIAETILMGLENMTDHFSYGKITKEQVEKMGRIADYHGFNLGRSKIEDSY